MKIKDEDILGYRPHFPEIKTHTCMWCGKKFRDKYYVSSSCPTCRAGGV